MRRIYYALGAVAVLAFGALRYCHDGSQAPKQPRQAPTAVEGVVAQPPEPIAANSVSTSDAGAQPEPLLRRLHALEGTNPDLAASLALEDRQRSPNSQDAEERDMVLVAALYNGRDIDGAKREAWYYFQHYPNGKFTDYLSKLTGLTPPKTPSR